MPEAFEFLRELWKRHPDVVAEAKERLGVVRVPARRVRGKRSAWRRADQTYLSSAWANGDRTLERLYGPFSEPEFLALEPPSDPREAEDLEGLLSVLGVADTPRSMSMPATGELFAEWRDDGNTKSACPQDSDHGTFRVGYSGAVLDRVGCLNPIRPVTSTLASLSAPDRGLFVRGPGSHLK
jgi:hypothetical protein